MPRPRRRDLTLDDLRHSMDGSALSTVELSNILGVTPDWVREDIEDGRLIPLPRRDTPRAQYRIPWSEARRYADMLGFFRLTA